MYICVKTAAAGDVLDPGQEEGGDLFARYTRSHRLVTVKTTNMGSLFKLTYHIELNSADVEKQLMDEMRCRNGNLEINITEQQTTVNEL